MSKAMSILGLGLVIGIAACTQAPGIPGSRDADGESREHAARQVQQNGSVVDIPFPPNFVRRVRQNRMQRANAECGRTYLACIDRFERLNPGRPGSFSGVSPTLRAACERQMDACYERYGVMPPGPRVN